MKICRHGRVKYRDLNTVKPDGPVILRASPRTAMAISQGVSAQPASKTDLQAAGFALVVLYGWMIAVQVSIARVFVGRVSYDTKPRRGCVAKAVVTSR